MSTRKIAASTLWQLGSQVTMAGLSILTVKFVAMGLSKELAGNYNSAYGYLQLFGILADFGLYAVAVREMSRAKNPQKVLGALIILRSIILLISLLSSLLIVWVLPVWRGTPLPLSVTIASLVPFFTLLAGILRTIFQVQYKMHFVFIAEVTQRIITAGVIGLFIAMGIRGSTDLQILHMFLFTGGIGAFVLFLLSFTYGNSLMRIRIAWDSDLLRSLLRQALPYGIAFLCVALYRQFDVSLIALLRDDYEIQNAYYGFVQRAMDMAYIIPTFLMNSALPIIAERDARGENTRRLAGGVLFAVLLLGTIAFLFAFIWARPLMQLLTTDAYLSTPMQPGADTALRLLSIPMFMNGIITFCFYSLLTRNRWEPLVLRLVYGVAIAFALNIWLIPGMGFIGASITSIVVHVTLTGLLLPAALRALPTEFPWGYAVRWGIFTALVGAFLFLTQPLLTNPVLTAVGLGVATAWMAVVAWMTRITNLLRPSV